MASDRENRPEVKPVIDLSNKEPDIAHKIAKQFIKSDFKTLRKWAFKDMFVPFVQNTILNGLSILFFESEYTKPRAGERSTIGKGSTKISYNKAYRGNLSTGRRDEAPLPDDDDSYIPDYRNELICESERDALRVLESMQNMIADYGDATVVQLYRLCNITHPDFQMNNWGWDKEAFKGSTYRRVRDGWVLMIPEAIYLSE